MVLLGKARSVRQPSCGPGQPPSLWVKGTVDMNASAPGEIWIVGAFPRSKVEPVAIDDDTMARCTWLTMTYADADGTVRVIEIPAGNEIRVTVEEIRPDPYAAGVEMDLMAIPPQSLSTLSDRGVKVVVEARRGSRSEGGILRIYQP
jgi:hypothetical protein